MITSKTTQLLSIGNKTSLLVLPVAAILLAAQAYGLPQVKAPDQIALADDDFGKVSEAYIKGLFDGEDRDEKLVQDQLSRADFISMQEHRFELHESRKGLGMVFFRTNKGNYGKLLYTWGIDLDLDSGFSTHLGAGLPWPNDYRPDIHCGSVHGPDRHLKGIDGASFLFPIENGVLDAD